MYTYCIHVCYCTRAFWAVTKGFDISEGGEIAFLGVRFGPQAALILWMLHWVVVVLTRLIQGAVLLLSCYSLLLISLHRLLQISLVSLLWWDVFVRGESVSRHYTCITRSVMLPARLKGGLSVDKSLSYPLIILLQSCRQLQDVCRYVLKNIVWKSRH